MTERENSIKLSNEFTELRKSLGITLVKITEVAQLSESEIVTLRKKLSDSEGNQTNYFYREDYERLLKSIDKIFLEYLERTKKDETGTKVMNRSRKETKELLEQFRKKRSAATKQQILLNIIERQNGTIDLLYRLAFPYPLK